MLKRTKKSVLLDDDEEEKLVLVSQNADKDGIFYTAQRLPERFQKKLNDYYDKKSDSWWFEEDEFPKIKKYIKKKGYKVRVAKLQQVRMSLGDALEKMEDDPTKRMRTPYRQLNKMLGGKEKKQGFVRGGLCLIGGDPGTGKSTLTNQLLLSWGNKRRVIYINTEESAKQVQERFKRLNEERPFNKRQKRNIILHVVQDVDLIRTHLKKETAEVVILDSLGGLVESQGASRGGTKILREASSVIADYVKWNNPKAVAIMIGHVNKDGKIAGPKSLQHMVDMILFLQGNGRNRTIQPFKNRYGSTGDIISVTMGEHGLEFEDAQTQERLLAAGQTIAHVAPAETEEWRQL